jgi:hypothetical protein
MDDDNIDHEDDLDENGSGLQQFFPFAMKLKG